jgi:NADP-dependent 3-hydroxy acid dehydrogenase YdfG
MSRLVFITGASSGIGQATALLLLEKDYRVILCGRRKERLERIHEQYRDTSYILTFDVSDKKAVSDSIDSLPENWTDIDILINNAGNAHGLDSIDRGSLEDWDRMIDSNVKGLLYVTRKIVPQMVKRKSGHIVNIGSIAGREVYPGGNVYCASKFAVDALNRGMRLDLHAHDIKVSSINPGLVETEFSEVRFKGNTSKAEKVYQGYKALEAQDIAETILFCLSRPRHVNMADILILPTAQAASTIVNKSN